MCSFENRKTKPKTVSMGSGTRETEVLAKSLAMHFKSNSTPNDEVEEDHSCQKVDDINPADYLMQKDNQEELEKHITNLNLNKAPECT